MVNWEFFQDTKTKLIVSFSRFTGLSQDNSHDTFTHIHTHIIISPKLYLTLERRGALLYWEYARQHKKKKHKYVFVYLLLFLAVCFTVFFYQWICLCLIVSDWDLERFIQFVNKGGWGWFLGFFCYMFNVFIMFLTNLHITSCVSSTRHISGFLSCPS